MAGHILLSIATKVYKNAFAAESRRLTKTGSFNQRKLRSPHTLSDGSLKVLFYQRQSVNIFLLSISFPLPSVSLSKRSPIHIGSLEGFVYHLRTVNAFLPSIFFPLPTCAIIWELVLRGSLVLCYLLSAFF